MPKGIYPRKKGGNQTSFKKGHSVPQEWRDKFGSKLKGIKRTDEFKAKVKTFMSGPNNPNRGKKLSASHIENMKKNHWSTKMKMSEEWIKNSLRRRSKSSLEKKFEDIIKRNNLPYKFTGNGDFFVGKKNPDFVNVNGEKIAIEVFYTKHKDRFSGGCENWKKKRNDVFSSYGWRLLFFNESQVNDDYVKNILNERID